jgi:hypothetical protein
MRSLALNQLNSAISHGVETPPMYICRKCKSKYKMKIPNTCPFMTNDLHKKKSLKSSLGVG